MRNIILCGFMGAGKTVVGKELAVNLGFEFVDTDELIEREQGISIKEIFEKYGEEYFRDVEYEMCKKISGMKNTVISTGGGVLTFERNYEILKKDNKIIFLEASFPIICERIANDKSRPLFQDIEKAKVLYEERSKKYLSVANYRIDGDLTVTETVSNIIDVLNLR